MGPKKASNAFGRSLITFSISTDPKTLFIPYFFVKILAILKDVLIWYELCCILSHPQYQVLLLMLSLVTLCQF